MQNHVAEITSERRSLLLRPVRGKPELAQLTESREVFEQCNRGGQERIGSRQELERLDTLCRRNCEQHAVRAAHESGALLGGSNDRPAVAG